MGDSWGAGTHARVQPVAGCKQTVARLHATVIRPTVLAALTRGGILSLAPSGWTARRIPDPPERNASPTVSAPQDDLRARLPALTLADEHRLGRRLDGLRRTRDPQARERQRERIAADVAVAEERIARRRAAVPEVSAIPTSCRSASGATTSPRRCGTTRSSSSPARPAPARPPSCPRSPSSSAAGSAGASGTPSHAGSPPAASPSGSPRSWTARWARSWAGRCGSPTRSATARWSS